MCPPLPPRKRTPRSLRASETSRLAVAVEQRHAKAPSGSCPDGAFVCAGADRTPVGVPEEGISSPSHHPRVTSGSFYGGATITSAFTHRSPTGPLRSEEHTSELQSRFDLVCRLLLEKKN